MKKNIFFFLLLFLTACSMPSAKNPAAANLPASEAALASPIVPLAPTSTLEIPAPTQSIQAVIVPTFTSLPLPQAGVFTEIKFAVGGTWTDIKDSVSLNSRKTYSLNAMQGQVMSVSTTGGYFPLQIQGRNGTVLCATQQNSDCYFWRGTLPLSQDYFITINSGGMQSDFTLRVAINPPGKMEQTFTYNTSPISLSYSDLFAPVSALTTLNNKTNPQLTLQLIDTSSYANTNLGEAYFVSGFSADPQIVSACTQPNQSGGAMEISNGNVSVNGYNYSYSTAFGAGAGNIYNQYIYRVVNNNTCYEVIYFIHSSNIGNYPPGVVKEFDESGLLQKFNGILTTLKLK